MKAKQAFVAFHEKGLPIPEEIADFITREFKKEIINHADNSVVENSEILIFTMSFWKNTGISLIPDQNVIKASTN